MRAERRARQNPALLGLVVLGLHAVALPGLLGQCGRAELAVDLAPGGAASLPAELAGRARHLIDGAAAPADLATLAPGVHREEWEVGYRGGFVRRVGRTFLRGPLQDPAHPPCGVRLVVSQTLLDRVEPVLSAQIAKGLDGQYGFKRVGELELGFSSDFGGAIVLGARLEFSRGDVPVAVVVRPRLEGGALALVIDVDAKVRLKSATASKVIEWFGVDARLNKLATELARSEVDKALGPVAAFLSRPPPVPLDGGRLLTLEYCHDVPIQVVTAQYLAVPLAVPLPQVPGDVRPVALDPGPPPGAPAAPLALDLSLDALNAVLHQLWATGYLDNHLAHAALEERFNALPDVRDLLTLRLRGPARLHLPPTVERSADPARPFVLAVEAGVDLVDGALVTPARLFGRMTLDLRTAPDGHLATDPKIGELAVTCEPRPGHLEPCYATIVDWAQGGTPGLHEPIAAELGRWFDGLVRERGFASPQGGGFAMERVRLTPALSPRSAWLRVELEGTLTP